MTNIYVLGEDFLVVLDGDVLVDDDFLFGDIFVITSTNIYSSYLFFNPSDVIVSVGLSSLPSTYHFY